LESNHVVQVSSSDEGIENSDGMAEVDLCAAEVSSGTEGFERSDEQLTNQAVQLSSGTQRIDGLNDQILNLDRPIQVGSNIVGFEELDDEIAQTVHGAMQVTAGSQDIDRQEYQFVENFCADEAGSPTEVIKSNGETLKADCAAQVNSDDESIENLGERLAETDAQRRSALVQRTLRDRRNKF
jgi:hypothetical protein